MYISYYIANAFSLSGVVPRKEYLISFKDFVCQYLERTERLCSPSATGEYMAIIEVQKLLSFSEYCNGFDKSIARQQLGKHLLLILPVNNGESIVVANVTARC
jgi:hypothetical protein